MNPQPNPADPKLDDYVNLVRDHFELNEKFSTKFGMREVCMYLDPDEEHELLFFEWITTTTHDAYLLFGEDKVVYYLTMDEFNRDSRRRYVYFFKKGTSVDDVRTCLFV